MSIKLEILRVNDWIKQTANAWCSHSISVHCIHKRVNIVLIWLSCKSNLTSFLQLRKRQISASIQKSALPGFIHTWSPEVFNPQILRNKHVSKVMSYNDTFGVLHKGGMSVFCDSVITPRRMRTCRRPRYCGFEFKWALKSLPIFSLKMFLRTSAPNSMRIYW